MCGKLTKAIAKRCKLCPLFGARVFIMDEVIEIQHTATNLFGVGFRTICKWNGPTIRPLYFVCTKEGPSTDDTEQKVEQGTKNIHVCDVYEQEPVGNGES